MATKTRKTKRYGPMLSIGTSPEAVRAAEAAVHRLATLKVDPTVAVAALQAFTHACEIKPVTISHNRFEQRVNAAPRRI